MKPVHRIPVPRRLALLLPLLVAACAGVKTRPEAPAARTEAPAREADRAAVAPERPSGWTPRSLVHARREMVAAAHPLAAQAGARVLAEGGGAVDAAVAVQMVLTLVEPQSSGLGGGGFMLVHRAGERFDHAWDGRETAPAEATGALFTGPDGKPLSFAQAQVGGRAVGTPGVLRMLEAAHREHGRLPWARLMQPAIELAEAGFPVSPRLHASLSDPVTLQRLREQGGSVAAYFLQADGTPRPVGHVLRNPALAETLRAIAAQGADALHRGPVAEDIVRAVRGHAGNPGLLSLQDLADYRPIRREPVCGTYRQLRVCGMPPPSSGGVTMLQTLGLLRDLNLGAVPPNSADAVHLVSEAYRLAYADRARYLADPAFVTVPVTGLLDAAYLAQRAALIRPDRSLGVAPAGVPAGAPVAQGLDASADLPATTHVSIVDARGDAVALTSSIEAAFGSFVMVRGFLLNNQLTDFSFVDADANGPVANRVQPGKRPRSSMAPTLVLDGNGRLLATLGSPGGAAIIQYVTRTVVALTDWKLDIQQAIDLPHFGSFNSPTTNLEKGSGLEALRPALEARGHVVAVVDQTSGLHGIVASGRPGPFARDPERGLLSGGADPRREGVAVGR